MQITLFVRSFMRWVLQFSDMIGNGGFAMESGAFHGNERDILSKRLFAAAGG